jgi:hypothetical protein
MASKRERLRKARAAVMRDLVEYLERQQSMSSTDEVLVIENLIVELRRRGGMPIVTPLPGQQQLPGMGLFVITFNAKEGPDGGADTARS